MHGVIPDVTDNIRGFGAVLNACWIHAEKIDVKETDAGQSSSSRLIPSPAANNRFIPPPEYIQNLSNALVLNKLLPTAAGLVIPQGTNACKVFCKIAGVRKMTPDELCQWLPSDTAKEECDMIFIDM